MITFRLDFTSWFIGGLLIGLVIVAIGISILLGPKRSSFGIFIIVVGAIPMLFCLVGLVEEPIDKLIDKWQDRVSTRLLPEDREYQGIRLPRGTKVEWRGSSFITSAVLAQPLTVLDIHFEGEMKFVYGMNVATDLETGTLAADRAIDGVPCKAHKQVEFFPADAPQPDDGRKRIGIGKLKRCTASAAFDFRGNRYQADAEVTLNSSDRVALGVLAADQDVDGHWCKQGTEVERLAERGIRFTLVRDETVSGIACKAGTEVVLAVENDRVKSAVLAHDQQIGGIPCRGGEAVVFEYGDGSYPLDSCVIRRVVTMLDEDWPAGTRLKELLTTDWLEVTLPRGSSKVIGDIKFVGRCRISFYKTPPRLREAKVVDGEVGYQELLGARYSEIQMYEEKGQGILAQPATIGGAPCKPGDIIDFKVANPK